VVLPIPKTPRGNRYALTNYGRVISFTTIPKEGNFLKPGLVSGYPAVSIRKRDTRQTLLLHRLVAHHFLRKPDRTYKFVLHLNHKKEDNHFKNLKWATFEEQRKHVLEDRMLNGTGNYKLTPKDVISIKKMIQKGKYRLKTIAEKFGVTDMQISRIKSGENWGHVKV
jgi:hypothetical protein